jgi:hypothetical protein
MPQKDEPETSRAQTPPSLFLLLLLLHQLQRTPGLVS